MRQRSPCYHIFPGVSIDESVENACDIIHIVYDIRVDCKHRSTLPDVLLGSPLSAQIRRAMSLPPFHYEILIPQCSIQDRKLMRRGGRERAGYGGGHARRCVRCARCCGSGGDGRLRARPPAAIGAARHDGADHRTGRRHWARPLSPLHADTSGKVLDQRVSL
jgi:hypothetical protein